MKELIEKKIFEIVTACRQARIEIGLHDLEPEGRNKVIDEMLHRAIIKANELEEAMKPKPIESAPKDGTRVELWYFAFGEWRRYQDSRWSDDDEFWVDEFGDRITDIEEIRFFTYSPALPSVGGEE